MKKLKTQAKSWKNSSQNSKKTQKPATPVELNWRKIVQKKSLINVMIVQILANQFCQKLFATCVINLVLSMTIYWQLAMNWYASEEYSKPDWYNLDLNNLLF